MAEEDTPKDTAKKGGGVLKKYKWWIVGGAAVFLGIIFVAIKKANSSTGSAADTSATTAANGGINPATGYLYGSPADVAAQGGSGTSTSVAGPAGVTGPAGPAGPPGPPGPVTAPKTTPTPVAAHNPYPVKAKPPSVNKLSTLYTVKSGDTLSAIAQHNPGTTWQQIYAANKSVIGGNPNMIHPGQRLHV